MRKVVCLIYVSLLYSSSLFSQVDSLSVDPNYLEDQLFFGITYNTFSNTPDEFLQGGFAYGFTGGFIKDIPFNTNRNFGMGIGLGYAYNTYIQNLVKNEVNSDVSFDDSYSLNVSTVELPIEVRWRTSTLEKYKFWRVYTGVTISYVFNAFASGQTNPDVIAFTDQLALERVQYALTLAAGYGTWNIYANYALTPFFKKGTQFVDGENLEMSTFRLGLMFYLY